MKKIKEEWCTQGDYLRIFLDDFVASLTKVRYELE